MQKKRIEVPIEIKADDEGHIEGYGSIFGNEDSYGDIVAKGAFEESLKIHREKGSMPAMLWQHSHDWPVGRWHEMREDDKGLFLRGEFADTQLGRDTRTLAKMGAITGLSIGFVPKKWEFDRKTEIRTLNEVDLWEVSLVTFPANDKARTTAIKSADEIDGFDAVELERYLREAGLSRSTAKAFMHKAMTLGAERKASELEAEIKLEVGLSRLLKSFQSV